MNLQCFKVLCRQFRRKKRLYVLVFFIILLVYYSAYSLKKNGFRVANTRVREMQMGIRGSVEAGNYSKQPEKLIQSSLVGEDRQKSDRVHEQIDFEMETRFPVRKVTFWRDVIEYRWKRFNASQTRPRNPSGPGEMGKSVLLTKDEDNEAKLRFDKESFNVIASDKVALDREIPDTRIRGCQQMIYTKNLPKASVIIVFCNEAPSALLRTVHSVVNRSPPDYLHEVILVDDFSDRPELKTELQETVDRTWPDGIVRILRSAQRIGLIRAKVMGADAATGDVLVFLDAHCEANQHWLEPLLARISEDRRAVLCPLIDPIAAHTLGYHSAYVSMGGFTWGLHFAWRPLPAREIERRKSPTDPVRSPTMAGGLFAIERNFFYEIGAYDPGMDVWGGENLEMSFRVWMCGGFLEFIPCSRVGHIFRPGHPYKFPDRKDIHGLNSKRLAEVWMDDYKRLFYLFRPDLKDKDAGDVSDRVALRQRLGCRSFKWYLNNIYPEKFIVDENVLAFGKVYNPSSNLCLDTLNRDEKTLYEIGLFYCHNITASNQVFSLSRENELRREESCLSSAPKEGRPVMVETDCSESDYKRWKHDKLLRTLKNLGSGLCLDIELTDTLQLVIAANCTGSQTQQWQFEHYLDL